MRPSQVRTLIVLAVLLFVLGWAVTTAANFIIEYSWWREVGQTSTWTSMLWYSIAPAAVGAVMAAAAVVAIVFASASIDYWTVMRFFGSRGVTLAPDAWKDHAFSRSLPFYLFHLPFYSDMLGFAFGFAILCALVFWPTAQGP